MAMTEKQLTRRQFFKNIGLTCACSTLLINPFSSHTVLAKNQQYDTREAMAGHVDPGQLKAILTGPAPSGQEQKAATELSRYLRRIYGISLPVKTGNTITEATTNVILIGEKAVLGAGAISREELDRVKWDGYVVKAQDGRIALSGPRGLATLFAVAGFLEHLGARFYGAAERIPSLKGEKIEEFVLYDKPTFEFRRINVQWQLKSSYGDMGDPRQGANPELFTKEKGSDLWIDHTAGYLVPKLLYYDEHPEYYAMLKNGQRIPKSEFTDHRTPLCLSNPDVTRISIERMIVWVEKQPERRFFPITYGDTSVWCHCPACKKLDAKQGEFADRNLYWVNGVAREVGKEYPDKVFLTLAYFQTRKPPNRLKPESNVTVLYAPFWGLSTMCRVHPYYSCNRSFPAAQDMEGWLKWAPENLGVYDYSIGGQLKMHAYEKKLKFWAKRGHRAFFELGNPKKFRNLENFVKSKLTWDASLDPEKLEDEFCDAYYGPAGKHVAAFIRLLYLEKGGDRGNHGGGGKAWVPDALDALEQAEQAVKGTLFENRFKKDRDLSAFLSKFRNAASQNKGEKPRARPKKETLDRTRLWLSKSRIARKKLKDDYRLTPLRAIHTLEGPAADLQVAMKLQHYIQKIYGVKVPVNTLKISISQKTREVILVGKKASLASGLINKEDFDAARKDGVVIRGLDGRIAIAASRENNTGRALEALLHIIRMRHGGPAMGNSLPSVPTPVIREFTLIDWPPFGPSFSGR
jgi:hypothetical protein